MVKKTSISYADAGVDIDAGDAFVDRIKPMVSSTKRIGSLGSIGGFGGLFDLKPLGYKDPVLVSGTDGVGTKLRLAIDTKTYHTIGIDLVAMCVNDIVVQGAEPLFFLDYFACNHLEVEMGAQVVQGIVEGCKQAGCALVGGETAEMPGMYAKDDFDLAGFAVGVVERDQILPKSDAIQPGDVLIGFPSSGVHSNGYSLVRMLLSKSGVSLDATLPGTEMSFHDAFLAPTIIYVNLCRALLKTGQVKAFAHITGGGITGNVPRAIPDGMAAEIQKSAIPHGPVFAWLQQAGNVTEDEMLRTFNCGIGMVAIISPDALKNIDNILNDRKQPFHVLGKIIASEGAADMRYIA